MPTGRVCTGFSFPLVATAPAQGQAASYTDGMVLARGVNVSISTTQGDDNIFYADNVAAESVGGSFREGTLTLTVDGLFKTARNLLWNLTTAASSTWTKYTNNITANDVGIGFIARYMYDGATRYVPYVLPRVKFDLPTIEAATQEEDISWQTETLNGHILKDVIAECWMEEGDECLTERSAQEKLYTYFSITPPPQAGN